MEQITDWEAGVLGQRNTRPSAGDLQWCRSNTDNRGTPGGRPLRTVLGSCTPAPRSSPPALAPSPGSWRVYHSGTASSPSHCCWTPHPHTKHHSLPSTGCDSSQPSSTVWRSLLPGETPTGSQESGLWRSPGHWGVEWFPRNRGKQTHSWKLIQKSSRWWNSPTSSYQNEGCKRLGLDTVPKLLVTDCQSLLPSWDFYIVPWMGIYGPDRMFSLSLLVALVIRTFIRAVCLPRKSFILHKRGITSGY